MNIFSKRKRRLENAEKRDVYQYDTLPQAFRGQVAHIWRDAIGPYAIDRDLRANSNAFWQLMKETLCREKGIFSLSSRVSNVAEQCLDYLMSADTEGALDIIELSLRVIDRHVREMHPYMRKDAKITQDPDSAIEELNRRFLEHAIGYQYMNGIIIRLDSQYIHSEVVRPALSLLAQPGYKGPEEEFIRALDHYRHGRDKEAVAEALKAFESTMKAICKARGWSHQANATAQPLIEIMFSNGLIPAELQAHIGGLRSAMESGLPTISNRRSRHGQGPDPQPIPAHFVAYALNLAASNIVFLLEAHKALN
ncbi:MAG: hypothetical protein ABSF46_21085 [Terriglobia bacterium]|jgi:hypothetical protein